MCSHCTTQHWLMVVDRWWIPGHFTRIFGQNTKQICGQESDMPNNPGWWFGDVWSRNFMTFHGNVIIPTDEHIFFRGVGQPPTRISGHFLCIVEKQWCLGVLQSNGRLWNGAWSDLAWSPATVAIAGKITCKWRNLGCSWMLSPCRFWVAFALFAA